VLNNIDYIKYIKTYLKSKIKLSQQQQLKMLSQTNMKLESSSYPGAIRLGQQSSINFRNGWYNFCKVYGELHAPSEKPVFDPASYSDEFIRSFFDCLGLCYAQSVEREGVAPHGMALAAKQAKVLGGPAAAKAKVIAWDSFSRDNINSGKSSENFSKWPEANLVVPGVGTNNNIKYAHMALKSSEKFLKRPEANLAVQRLGTNHSIMYHPAANIKPPAQQVDGLGANHSIKYHPAAAQLAVDLQQHNRKGREIISSRVQPPRSSMDNKRLSLPQMDQRSRQQAPTRVGRAPSGLWSHFNTKPDQNLLRSRKEGSNKLDYLAKDHLLPRPPSHQNLTTMGVRKSRKGDSNILY
jgi:hypothetical protein